MKKELRENSEDCKRLIRESRKLIKRAREIMGSDVADKLSEVFGETQSKSKSKAASGSSRDKSRF